MADDQQGRPRNGVAGRHLSGCTGAPQGGLSMATETTHARLRDARHG